MDISKVLNALIELNIVYQAADFSRGVALGLSAGPASARRIEELSWSNRHALKSQCAGLVVHDRLLSGGRARARKLKPDC